MENEEGYYTECIHYPLKEKNILSPNGKGRISHSVIEKINKKFKKEIYTHIDFIRDGECL
jgi:hypothetical protein